MVVVFPEPFGPRNPYVLPAGTARSMPSTARRLPKCLAKPRVSTAIPAVSAGNGPPPALSYGRRPLPPAR